MDVAIEWVKWIYENYAALLGAVTAVIMSLIVLFEIIPGEQPEKALQAAVDFLKKFSRK